MQDAQADCKEPEPDLQRPVLNDLSNFPPLGTQPQQAPSPTTTRTTVTSAAARAAVASGTAEGTDSAIIPADPSTPACEESRELLVQMLWWAASRSSKSYITPCVYQPTLNISFRCCQSIVGNRVKP